MHARRQLLTQLNALESGATHALSDKELHAWRERLLALVRTLDAECAERDAEDRKRRNAKRLEELNAKRAQRPELRSEASAADKARHLFASARFERRNANFMLKK